MSSSGIKPDDGLLSARVSVVAEAESLGDVVVKIICLLDRVDELVQLWWFVVAVVRVQLAPLTLLEFVVRVGVVVELLSMTPLTQNLLSADSSAKTLSHRNGVEAQAGRRRP